MLLYCIVHNSDPPHTQTPLSTPLCRINEQTLQAPMALCHINIFLPAASHSLTSITKKTSSLPLPSIVSPTNVCKTLFSQKQKAPNVVFMLQSKSLLQSGRVLWANHRDRIFANWANLVTSLAEERRVSCQGKRSRANAGNSSVFLWPCPRSSCRVVSKASIGDISQSKGSLLSLAKPFERLM